MPMLSFVQFYLGHAQRYRQNSLSFRDRTLAYGAAASYVPSDDHQLTGRQ